MISGTRHVNAHFSKKERIDNVTELKEIFPFMCEEDGCIVVPFKIIHKKIAQF